MAKRPTVSRIDDAPLLERMRAVAVPGGVATTLRWTMVDDAGLPVDLTDHPADPGSAVSEVQVRFREAVANNDGSVAADGAVVDRAAGEVEVPLSPNTLARPAIYLADVAVMDQAAGAPRLINRLLVHCEPTLFAASRGGPPARADVRLRLRDSSPAENRLLDERMFDDAEIAQALLRVVQFWNSTNPPVAFFDTSNFPHQFQWIEGACALLHRAAATWYRKNKLTSSAGGVAVNDMDKADEFDRLAALQWDEFSKWVKNAKVAANMAHGFGGVGSPYRYGGPSTGFGRRF